MENLKMHKLVFVGGFAEYFLWGILLILSVIPILGSYLHLRFIKWLAKNTIIMPIEFDERDIRALVESRKAQEALRKEIGSNKPQ